MNSSRIDATQGRGANSGFFLSLLAFAAACSGFAAAATVDPHVRAIATRDGGADVLLVLADQSTPLVAPLRPSGDYRARRQALVDALQARAGQNPRGPRASLAARRIPHRAFWTTHGTQARVPLGALDDLAATAAV